MPHIEIKQASLEDADIILHLQMRAYLSEAEIYNDYSIPPLIESLKEIKSEFVQQVFGQKNQTTDIRTGKNSYNILSQSVVPTGYMMDAHLFQMMVFRSIKVSIIMLLFRTKRVLLRLLLKGD
jgi:hypothetical protein